MSAHQGFTDSKSNIASEKYELATMPPKVLDVNVLKTYEGRVLFLTGATGFVGKVILEKILRSIPDIGKVYLLVRPRKGQKPYQRLKEEVLSSPVFDTIRSQRADFDTWVDTKLVAIAGELTADNVGISPEDYNMILNDLDMIIHCAAVVDFNERLDRAIQLNTLGSLRMLEIAKRSKRCSGFVHVSTCYVNSNLPNGHIEERLYPLGFEPEELIAKVQKMSPTELDTVVSTGILRNWPNTYTMTKSMAEHLLIKNKEHIPVVIVRPSIVGAARSEPVPGWVDVVSAAGAVYTAMGMGVIRFLYGSPSSIGDVIPVDYVSNSILVSLAVVYKQTNKYYICHAASSSEKPMYWGYAVQSVQEYFKKYQPPRAISDVSFQFARTPQIYQLRFFLQYSIPSSILNTISLLGNPGWKKKAQLFEKLQWQVRVITEAFRYFVENQWIFDNKNVRTIYSMLDTNEKSVFPLDLHDVDWHRYNELFAYGLNKYTFKLPTMPVYSHTTRYTDLIEDQFEGPPKDTIYHSTCKDLAHVQDVLKAREDVSSSYPKPPSTNEFIDQVLHADSVRTAIAQEAELLQQKQRKKSANGLTPVQEVEQRAKNIVTRMFSNQNEKTLSKLAWVFRKLWKKLYSKVLICREHLDEIRDIVKNENISLIYIPTHRSYVDFLLCSYLTYVLALPTPHIAAGEDFLALYGVKWMLRAAGAFFIRRSFLADNLYTVILQEYIDVLLRNNQSLEFYIEGTRSRTGKMLQPKIGMLSMIMSSIQRGITKDVVFVPMSFNYEKPLETSMYSTELLGENKKPENVTNLMKASTILKDNFGKVTVVFKKPIYASTFIQEKQTSISDDYVKHMKQATQDTQIVLQQAANSSGKSKSSSSSAIALPDTLYTLYMNKLLAYRIIHQMSQGNEVMPTHIIASLMLQYRQGITRAQLTVQFEWLYKELLARKALVYGVEGAPLDSIITESLQHLNTYIRKQNKHTLEPAISTRPEYVNTLALTQYKNRIVSYFYLEALWCVVAKSFLREKKSIHTQECLGLVQFLHALLKNEFIVSEFIDTPIDHMATFTNMVKNGIFVSSTGDASSGSFDIATSGEMHFAFFCSLLWPHIDALYNAALLLYSLETNNTMTLETLVSNAQVLATTQYHEGRIAYFESCSRDTLSNAFNIFKHVGILQIVSSPKKVVNAEGNYEYLPVQYKLSDVLQQDKGKIETIIDRLSRLRKTPLVDTKSRKELIYTLPGMSRLSNSAKL